MRQLLLYLFLAQAVALPAAESPASMGKRFLKLKDDGGLYVGEGLAATKDFKGDGLKALEAARERARASLASAIRVRIVSETREESKAGPEGSSESVESKSSSLADVVLENVRYEDFPSFPSEGQVSSLAMVSKEDYRRQLAGKGPRIYRPQWGLRLAWVATTTFSVDKFIKDEDAKRRSLAPAQYKPGANSQGSGSSADSTQGPGLEFRFRDWSLSAELGLAGEVQVNPYDPAAGLYGAEKSPLELISFGVGYDWTPWAWRFQPYVPLGLRYAHMSVASYEAWAAAGIAGLGLRWWPNDSLAFDFSGRYVQGLNKATLAKDGKDFYAGPGQVVQFDPSGAQWQASILWSGF